eukprot:TRINITY_DN1875_c0_g1_i1.p2 TRINITY_DN1875_c0_g1~~TRINITY_DN1875_c0_g1_i1.p2  ORF type:complete len:224 (-),score=69.40 TRINITY_DN1875_c0_g1_i1:202-819(-)
MALEQPKRPVGGGYGQFLAEKRPEFMKACEGQKASAVSVVASAAWKKLTDAQKKPYDAKFEQAKAKFEKDMEAFLAAGGTKTLGSRALKTQKRKEKEEGGGRRKRAKKDPNRPKKPAGGAFGVFLNKNRAVFQKECPGDMTGVTKLASAKWKAMSDAEKAPYEAEYQVKKKAFEEAMKSYVPTKDGAGSEEEEEGDEDDDGEEED